MKHKCTSLDVDELFEAQSITDDMELDVDVPQLQEAQITLSDGFLIDSMSAVKKLKEFVALNYTNHLNLYRGHESTDYKIESTIARLLKQNNNCSPQDVVKAEQKEYKKFCNEDFKEDWLKYKLSSLDEDMFKMSIGRHLGLPCRLIDVTISLETAIWFAVMNSTYYNQDGEIVLVVLNKDEFVHESQSPFNATKVSYAHEPFGAMDSLDELPLGEQRRFIQHGHFIWVDNNSLLKEQQVIEESALAVRHFIIPKHAKPSLAADLYQDVFSGCAYRSNMVRIKKCIAEF